MELFFNDIQRRLTIIVMKLRNLLKALSAVIPTRQTVVNAQNISHNFP